MWTHTHRSVDGLLPPSLSLSSISIFFFFPSLKMHMHAYTNTSRGMRERGWWWMGMVVRVRWNECQASWTWPEADTGLKKVLTTAKENIGQREIWESQFLFCLEHSEDEMGFPTLLVKTNLIIKLSKTYFWAPSFCRLLIVVFKSLFNQVDYTKSSRSRCSI